jgi:HEAT repeat protein
VAARLVSLVLGLTMLGGIGWMMWSFPRFAPPPSVQQAPSEKQLASLAHINPLLQPEVETAPPTPPVPVPPQRPFTPSPAPAPDAPRPPAEPPVDRPPLPEPPSPPKEPAPKEPAPKEPPAKLNDADGLADELVKASPQQHTAILEKLRTGKGADYTEALAAVIARLSDEGRAKARQALAERLARFTSRTLLAYLGSEEAELRRAAALAFGMKEDRDHLGVLIDLLEDPNPEVVRAAHTVLQKLTGKESEHGGAPSSGKTAEVAAPRTPPPTERPSLPPRPRSADEGKAPAESRAGRSRAPAKEDDVPDVALVPPEETSTEMKRFIRVTALALSSPRASERLQAARTLGELGEQAREARRPLCAAMLDSHTAVRVAAADALKSIDPRMHYLAVVLATEKVTNESDANRVAALLKRIQNLDDDGEPLAPLVAYVVKFSAANGTNDLLITSLTTLSRVGRKDLSSFRVVASALGHRDHYVRTIALRGLARMKHGKLAVARILALLRIDIPVNRVAAIETLVAVADESTEEIIAEAIHAQRYHNDEIVRRAVEAAENKLENKKLDSKRDP